MYLCYVPLDLFRQRSGSPSKTWPPIPFDLATPSKTWPPIPFDMATHPTVEETYIALLEAVLRHAEGGEALAHRVEDGGRDLGRIRPLLHLSKFKGRVAQDLCIFFI